MLEDEHIDVLIVGGGPSGISAAIWCADLGISHMILERERELFGQLRWIHNPIENYPGLLVADGAELISSFGKSIERWNLRTKAGVTIAELDCRNRTARLEDGTAVSGKVMIIGTGVRRRTIGIPGEAEFRDKGLLRSGAGEREKVSGNRVVVVGGGDAAAENALLLSDFADRVLLVHRRDRLTARDEFRKRVEAAHNIEVILSSEIERIGGAERLEWVEIRSDGKGESTRLQTDHVIVRIGVVPNSDLVTSQLTLDEKGYVIIDHNCRTNVDGVYAIGDLACPVSPTIATAIGTGATAAKSAYALLTSGKTV